MYAGCGIHFGLKLFVISRHFIALLDYRYEHLELILQACAFLYVYFHSLVG